MGKLIERATASATGKEGVRDFELTGVDLVITGVNVTTGSPGIFSSPLWFRILGLGLFAPMHLPVALLLGHTAWTGGIALEAAMGKRKGMIYNAPHYRAVVASTRVLSIASILVWPVWMTMLA